MSLKSLLPGLGACFLLLAACAQNDVAEYSAPEKGDPEYYKGKNTRADELYVNGDSEPGGRDFRNVYIAPANLSKLQIIQPEGATPGQVYAAKFIDFVASEEGQGIIRRYGVDLYGEPMYNDAVYAKQYDH